MSIRHLIASLMPREFQPLGYQPSSAGDHVFPTNPLAKSWKPAPRSKGNCAARVTGYGGPYPPEVVPGRTPAMLDFARIWQADDKIVYSKSR